MTRPIILVVDDEEAQRALLKTVLEDAGYCVREADGGEPAVREVLERPPDLVLMDLKMRGLDGLGALARIRTDRPAVPVIMMTAYATVKTAVSAMKAGAFDYLVKPLDLDELRLVVAKTLAHRALETENVLLRSKLAAIDAQDVVVGDSEAMSEVFRMIELAAPADVTVLLTGESGTGKGLLAAVIHGMSPRRAKAFVKVNCGALAENLLESELFGIEKRVATGVDEREGKFEFADGGSIFLDEVEAMPLKLQVKLLRVLQEMEFEKVGGNRTTRVDVRVIAATNRALEDLVEQGLMREDLYYRLNVLQIRVPPLRERIGDLEPLIMHFLGRFAEKSRKTIRGLSPGALAAMNAYHWPGNVRELMNVLERAVILTRHERIVEDDLPASLRSCCSEPEQPASTGAGMSLRQAEKSLILQSLEATRGNRSQAARMLGISRRTLLNKLKEYEH
ncbi:sigma-54-dependent Fis family transcriptional regulator [bacterium]|nr:sigma-54-dependent Fis family transcriptional regulator [candidate division CSSED10-310 bacterium]